MSWLASNTFEIQNLTPVLRLSGAGTGDEGEAAALKASAKEAGSLEDKQLAEALARFSKKASWHLTFDFLHLVNVRSASDHSMDTGESKPGTSGAPSTASAATPQTASADTFKESDVTNIVSMGFGREVFLIPFKPAWSNLFTHFSNPPHWETFSNTSWPLTRD